MKKLILGAAAMVAGLVFADSEITSSNVVGYNQAVNTENPWIFIGASFEQVNGGTIMPFNSLACAEGFSDGDQIQTAYTDENGLTQMKGYEYWDGDGWADSDMMDVVEEGTGLELGTGAWFISESPKSVITSGGVKKNNHIHTVTEPWSIVVSAFPAAFCPNSANVSWGCADGSQIQTAYTDDNGLTQMKGYEYWDGEGWADSDMMDLITEDTAVVGAGVGFWFIVEDPASSSFTEVSPLAE